MTAVILRGDARNLPLPDECVDLIVTSPPYFGLRSYTDGGEHYAGQIGAEPTPAEYAAALLDCTREWIRVLKPEGSIFVNRLCVNPSHLEPVTPGENTRRGLSVATFNALKTHCPAGHPYTPENTYRQPSRPNTRRCRRCQQEYDRKPHRKNRKSSVRRAKAREQRKAA